MLCWLGANRTENTQKFPWSAQSLFGGSFVWLWHIAIIGKIGKNVFLLLTTYCRFSFNRYTNKIVKFHLHWFPHFWFCFVFSTCMAFLFYTTLNAISGTWSFRCFGFLRSFVLQTMSLVVCYKDLVWMQVYLPLKCNVTAFCIYLMRYEAIVAFQTVGSTFLVTLLCNHLLSIPI